MALSLIVACSQDAPEKTSDASNVAESEDSAISFLFGSRDHFNSEVDRLIGQVENATNETTIKINNKTYRQLIPKPNAVPEVGTVTLDFAPVPEANVGTVIASVQEPPRIAVITNHGAIVASDNESITVYTDKGKGTVFPAPAVRMQLDATGDRLLIQFPTDILIADANELKEIQRFELPNFFGDEAPPGAASWHPTDPNQLILVSEQVSFNASDEYRVLLEATAFDLTTKGPIVLDWTPFRRFANLGTLPSTGVLWAQRVGKYQILPLPGPLFSLNDGSIDTQLVARGDRGVFQPTAAIDGTMVALDTPRYGSRASRARLYPKDEESIQLTGTHTIHGGISPNGEAVFTIARNGDAFDIRLYNREEIETLSEVSREWTELDQAMETEALELEESLRSVFMEGEMGKTLQVADFGNFLGTPPTETHLKILGDAMEKSLERLYGKPFEKDWSGMADLDTVMDRVSPFLKEEPWTVMALSKAIERRLPVETSWILTRESMALGQEVSDLVSSDELTHTAINIFGVSRERISSGLGLVPFTQDLIRNENGPFFLVENFNEQTITAAMWKVIDSSGLDLKEMELGELVLMLKERTINDGIHWMAWQAGSQNDFDALAMMGAYRLLDSNPTSSASLDHFGVTMIDAWELETALRIYETATALNPDNGALWFERGATLYYLDRFEEARECYAIAAENDDTGLLVDEIQTRLKLIDDEVKAAKP